jgi:hypothetical protein
MTGLARAWFSCIFRTNLAPPHLDTQIEGIVPQMRAHTLSQTWLIGPSTRPATLGTHLAAQGLTRTNQWVGMALALQDLQPTAPAPSAVLIEVVQTSEALASWAQVITRRWPEALRPLFYQLFASLELGPEGPWRFYLGRLHGVPVATSMLFVSAAVAGIYWVHSSPEVRRQGIGTAMTLAPLQEARAQGLTTGVLQATPLGQPSIARWALPPIAHSTCTHGRPKREQHKEDASSGVLRSVRHCVAQEHARSRLCRRVPRSQHARPATPVLPAEEQRRGLAVHTCLASAVPPTDAQRRGPRSVGVWGRLVYALRRRSGAGTAGT